MDDLVLCIVGVWECKSDGRWDLLLTKDQVSRTVRLGGISSHRQLNEKIASVFGIDLISQRINITYWSPNITVACTQTKLPPVAIECDDDLMLFLKFFKSLGGLNLFVSWESLPETDEHQVLIAAPQVVDVPSSDEDGVDNDELIAHLEYVETEYKKNIKAHTSEVDCTTRKRNSDDDVVVENQWKKQAVTDITVYQGRGTPGSSEETVPNPLFDEMARLVEEEISLPDSEGPMFCAQPPNQTVFEEGETSSPRNQRSKKYCGQPVGFSLGIPGLEDMNNINAEDDFDEDITDDQPQVDNIHGNNSGCAMPYSKKGGELLFVGSIFSNKASLRKALAIHAMDQTFAFKIEYSNKSRIIAVCVASECDWRVYATRHQSSDNFEIKTLSLTHTCSVDARSRVGEKATYKVLAGFLQAKYANGRKGPRACDLQEIVLSELKVTIPYMKAWRGKELALSMARGDEEASYNFLPTYLHLLKLTNPGSITELVTKEDNLGREQFRYLFLSYGATVSGCASLRKVVVIDGTQLKGKYKGCLLGASAQDGNMHIYPLAFGVVDSENEDSWTWFLQNLTKLMPDCEDLLFVSDRAKSIYPSIKKVYPSAHHASCTVHLYRNVRAKFKSESLAGIVSKAARSYTVGEFKYWWAEIESRSPSCAKYLLEAGLEHWTLVYCPISRYNIMSSNIAESVNAVMKTAAEYPIVAMLDFLRITLMRWFSERREKAIATTSACTPNVEKLLVDNLRASASFSVLSASYWIYEVNDGSGGVFTVDLQRKRCTCRAFDVLKFPCSHAVAARKVKGINIYSLVEDTYSTMSWRDIYSNVIMPLPRVEDIDVPEAAMVHPPRTKRPPGRPRTSRIASIGERYLGSSRKSSTCTRCSGIGHNRKSCKEPI